MPRVRISKIRKRDGRIVMFEVEKISNAISRAFDAVGRGDGDTARRLAEAVTSTVEEKFPREIPSVEDVQDCVERVLIKEGYNDVAKAYILYRQRRTEIRETKQFLGIKDDLKLSVNAASVLEKRYLLKDDVGNIVETSRQMFRRVAKAAAQADLLYDKKSDVLKREEEFYGTMAKLEFLPNSPTLMNAGTRMGQLSACFVLPVPDSIRGIFDAVKYMAMIHQSGGGTGFSFSHLRPIGDVVRSTHGIASGPVSFMRVFDAAADVIKQGGRRRGANMGILRVDHPDILEFIQSKSKEGRLTNFNISVAVTDDFMKKVENHEEYDLTNPRSGRPARQLKANDVFDLIVSSAWATGDPGLLFLDEINRHNPTPQVGPIESTNPCGEQPLLPYESCNLGSVNLSKMVEDGALDREKLRDAVALAVRFLDNVIDVNKYPIAPIAKITRMNRKIGVGIMGFAEMLIKLGVAYDSEEAVQKASEIMKFISEEAIRSSRKIAEERGSFPNFEGSLWEKKGLKHMRNATVTTIAPTGTLSIIAECSSGIEPIFAVSFIRNVLEGTRLLEVNPVFEQEARKRGFYSNELMMEIAKKGSVQSIQGVPEDVRRLFVTAFDIAPKWHVRMQAAFQEYTDNAVSKTVNLPHDATMDDVRETYVLAYRLKCKGITVYRYGSKSEQVLYVGGISGKERGETLQYVGAQPEYSGGCPTPTCALY